MALSARTQGRDGGEIRHFSESSKSGSIASQGQSSSQAPCQAPSQGQEQEQEQAPNPSGEIRFTGTRVLLEGDSVDKPDPLRPAWRFWIQGARFAEAVAEGQREVRIAALNADEPRQLPARLLLAWLLGIVLTEAASA